MVRHCSNPLLDEKQCFLINKTGRSGYDPERPVFHQPAFNYRCGLPWRSCFSRAIWCEARFCAAPTLARSLFVITPSDIALSSILFTCSCCLFSLFPSRSFSCPLAIP